MLNDKSYQLCISPSPLSISVTHPSTPYLSYPNRYELDFGVYSYVSGGGLFNGDIADKIHRVVVLREIKMAAVKTEKS